MTSMGATSPALTLPSERPSKTPLEGLVAGAVLVAFLTVTPIIKGKLQLLDVACLAVLPFLASRVVRDRRLLVLALTLAVWAIGQLVSDHVNGLGLRGSMQFVTAITVLGIVSVLVCVTSNDMRRMCFVQAGIAVGLSLELLFVARNPLASAESWKYGFNTPVALGVLALTDLAWQRGRRIPSLVALAFIVVLAVVTDHRHLAAVAALTGLVMMTPQRQHRHPRVVSTAIGLMLLVGALSGAFLQSAKAGLVGGRTEAQVAYFGTNPLSFLVNVRPEPFQELYLFTRRPVTGWGSQPQIDTGTFDASLGFLQDIGVRREDLVDLWLELGGVPGVFAHSTAVDSWVRAGVAAIPFWAVAGVLTLWAGILAINYRASPLVVLWTMLIVWNAFFEPMTARYHLELAAYLALAVTTIRSLNQKRAWSVSVRE